MACKYKILFHIYLHKLSYYEFKIHRTVIEWESDITYNFVLEYVWTATYSQVVRT